MILLLHKGHATIVRELETRDAREYLGRLVCPVNWSGAAKTNEVGIPWAADNRAFVDFQPGKYSLMLAGISGLTPIFVTAPDVVGDAKATDILWRFWAPIIEAHDLAPAYVAQDGFERIPHNARAVFIGGTDEFKLGAEGRRACKEAHRRGLWLHMGRVNGIGRIGYANELGVDSIDGTQWSRFTNIYLTGGLAACSAPRPERLWA